MRKRNFLKLKDNLIKEVRQVENGIYSLGSENHEEQYFNLLFKRDDLIRAQIVSLHLSFEDILDDEISRYIYRQNRKNAHGKETKAYRRSKLFRRILRDMHNLSFNKKISMAKYLRILTTNEAGKLKVLNDIRNKCAHNWLANSYVWKKYPKELRGKKRPLVEFQGKNVFNKDVFLKKFLPEFGPLYFNLLKRILGF